MLLPLPINEDARLHALERYQDVLWDGVTLEVAVRKLSDDLLRMLESSVEHASDAILVTEAEPADEPGPTILHANQAFTRISGYTVAEVRGKNPPVAQGLEAHPHQGAQLSQGRQ